MILFMDSFEHLAHANDGSTTKKWATVEGSSVTGRVGSGGFDPFAGTGATLNFAAVNTIICQFAVKSPDTSGMGADAFLVLYGGVAGNAPTLSLVVLGNGTLRLLRGNPGNSSDVTVANSTAGLIVPGTSHYIEIEQYTHATAGWVRVYVDDALIFNLSAINTEAASGGDGTLSRLKICRAEMNDDFILMDNSGPAPFNARLGDKCVRAFPMVGNGSLSQWARTGGDANGNYTAIDDATPDHSTSYVASASVGNVDEYAMADIVGAVEPLAFAVNAACRKTDAGARSIQLGVTVGGVTAWSPSFPVQDSWSVKQHIFPTAPSGEAWTITTVNAAKPRIKDAA